MDASTRFKEGNITAIVQHADRWGVYVSRNGWMLPQHVAQPMMDYFRVSWALAASRPVWGWCVRLRAARVRSMCVCVCVCVCA